MTTDAWHQKHGEENTGLRGQRFSFATFFTYNIPRRYSFILFCFSRLK